jgi:hypothetical protein
MTQEEIKDHAQGYALTICPDNGQVIGEGARRAARSMLAQGWEDGFNASYNHAREVAELDAAEVTAHSTGVELIAAERRRQVLVKGFDNDNDDMLSGEELSDAAVCFAIRGYWRNIYEFNERVIWPFDKECPSERLRESRIEQLTKAGALIAAEIDRLKRLENGKE